jgi:hypothetical protein
MWTGFIGKQIKRSDRNILQVNLSLILVPLFLLGLNWRYWDNFISGPFKTTPQQLESIKDPDDIAKFFVAVVSEDVVQTGVQEITEHRRGGVVTSEEVSAEFVALVVEKRLLLVKANAKHINQKTFTGTLIAIPQDVRTEVLDDLPAESQDIKDAFLPVMLVEEDFRVPGYVALALSLPTIGLGIWNLQKVGRRWGKPEKHPIAQSLAKVGDPGQIAAQIEHELQSNPQTPKFGATTVTAGWLLREEHFGLTTLALGNVIWAYIKVTSHKRYGITVGKSWAVHLFDREGKEWSISGQEAQVEQIIQTVVQRVPWIFVGYSDELQNAWLRQRHEMIAVVDSRRQQVQAAG